MPDNITPVNPITDGQGFDVKPLTGGVEITVPDIGVYPIVINMDGKKTTLVPGTKVTVSEAAAERLAIISGSRPQEPTPDPNAAPATIGDVARMIEESGGETYEVVAEIEVGTMEERSGVYVYQPSDSIPLARNETLFFNSEEYPLEYDEEGTTYYYNFDGSTGLPTGTPAYAVFLDGGSINALFSNTDLSNTTVRILKKVEQGGGELPEVTSADNGDVLTVVDGAWAKAGPNPNLKPTYHFGFTITAGQTAGTYIATPDTGVTYAAIRAAIEETSNIKAVGHINGFDVYFGSFLVGSAYVVFEGAVYMGESIGWTCVRLVVANSTGPAVYISPISTT